MHNAAEVTFKQQAEILERSIALAKQFKTDKCAASTSGVSTILAVSCRDG